MVRAMHKRCCARRTEKVRRPKDDPSPHPREPPFEAPLADFTGFMLLGDLVEFGVAHAMFVAPNDPRTSGSSPAALADMAGTLRR